MNKLYYANHYYSTPDCKAGEEALGLNEGDIYTSSEVVIWAAKALVCEGVIDPFIAVVAGKEYPMDSDGRSHNFPELYLEKYLDRLL